MKLTITRRAYDLLYYSWYMAILFTAIPLADALGIPERLRILVTGCIFVLLTWANLRLAAKGWLNPMMGGPKQAKIIAMRLGRITIEVVPAKARMTVAR